MKMMRTEVKDGIVTIFLEGRIDTGNAADVEKEILGVLSENDGTVPVFDASGLDYISSAGLRVLMKVRKTVGAPVEVREVSGEVYEIFETTGFTELLDVKKRLREISIEGCEQIGAGLSSRVYRIDRDTIVKVFHPEIGLDRIEEERESARTAFVNGIPTAITFDVVKVGDNYGTVYELIDAVQLSKFLRDNPDKAPEYRIKYADMLKDMHRIELTDKFQDMKEIYHGWIDDLKPYLEQNELDALHGLVGVIPDRNTFVHCDAHVGNTMVQDGELILIDMADVGRGHPIFDIGTLSYHYQIIPGSQARDFGMRTILGFVPETNEFMDLLWKDVINEYFKPKDEKELMMIYAIAGVGGGLRSIATLAKQSQMDEKYKKMAIEGSRQMFLPKLDEYTELLRHMDVYFER